MRSLVIAGALSCLMSGVALSAECPKEINPCKVMILSPQQHEWLAGKQQSSTGSVLDAASKNLGSDASGVIAQLLFQARAAVDGLAPKLDGPPADVKKVK